MSPRLLVIGITLWLSINGQTLLAATVLLRDAAEPVRGILLEENERGVLLRLASPDGLGTERFIPRESIDVILRPVDATRLAALTPEQPSGYRDYAEELAEKRVDPEALETSIRLYLIAAHLDPEKLGKSALLGMSPLARNEGERRRFRAMAFLLDPARNPRLLQSDGSSKEPATESTESPQVAVLRRALEMLRRGRYQEANRLVRRTGISEVLQENADLLTLDEFLEACGDRSPRGPEPPPELLARILRLELRLLDNRAPPTTHSMAGGAPTTTRWSELPREAFHESVAELNLETLTEFDPRESLFREGKWIAPDTSAD